MAGGSRRGDMVLGGRHLVGIFALLVVVLGVTFTLGYLLGRSQYEGQVSAVAAAENETPAAQPKTAPAAASPASGPSSAAPEAAPPSTWDFYRSGEPAKAAELEPAPKPAPVPAPAPAPAIAPARPADPAPAKAAAKPPAPAPARAAAAPRAAMPGGSALIPKGAITLQVAALVREADALALAQELQEKKFPAIVTTPSTDKYYRVQVGPFPDMKAATAARRKLEENGFKPMVRR